MNKSDSIKNLAIALCKFQSEVSKIKKTETNPFFKSKYADLSSILDVIRDPMSANGLSFVQFPTGDHELTTLLMHESGEWIQGTYKMEPVKKPIKQYKEYGADGKGVGNYSIIGYESDPQGLGSVITYQRRYALGAILGLNIDEDDDANKSSNPGKTSSDSGKNWLNPNTEQWNEAIKYLSTGGKIESIEKKYKISATNRELLISNAI